MPTTNVLDDLAPRGLREARLAFSSPAGDVARDVELVAERLRSSPTSRVAIAPGRDLTRQTVVSYLAAVAAGLTPALLRPSSIPDLDHLAAHGFGLVLGEVELQITAAAERDRTEDLILFTSGTTSRPKGVRFSAAAIAGNVAATQSFLRLDGDDRIALPLPVHFSYGLSVLHLALHTGAALTFVDHGQPPVVWLADVLRLQPTVLPLLPHQVRLLLRADDFTAARLPALRTITVAGGPLAPAAVDSLAARFPDARIHLMYGQTEAGPRISHVGPDGDGTIGRGIAGHTTLRLTPGAGAVGELQVKSDSLLLGYLDADDPLPIVDGWLATGDLATADDSGAFTIVGRCAPFFKPFDERVSFDEVLGAAAVVLPGATFRLAIVQDALRGETVELTAFVDAGDLSAPDAQRALRRALGSARAPIAVRIVPRTSEHKLG
jgi:acyl-coenzyme A synthetase/AMP-(fatty) acid ligase